MIEDDPDMSFLVGETIKRTGWPSLEFSFSSVLTMEDGLSVLAKGGIDLVLLDLVLPGYAGLETYDELRQHFPNVPVIVFTGFSDQTLALDALRRGAQDYLVKGKFEPAMLVRSIVYAFERSRIRAELDFMTAELRTANASIERLIMIDPLTELLNRRGLQQILTREVELSRRDNTDLLALLIDIDDFKKINDSLGHAVGDIVLKEIARKLKITLRATDYLARVGGDKFAVILPQTKAAEGIRVAEKVRLAVNGVPVSVSAGQALKLTASLGLINISTDVSSIDELLTRAHPLLFRSKLNGKNRVSCEPGKDETDAALVDFHGVFRDRNQFHAIKQAIFDLGSRNEIGYEFLSRSNVRGFEMPDDFFRASLEANLLTLVDHHCLKACISASSSVRQEARLHLNLFPSTLIDIPVQHLIQELPLDFSKNRFCIEISEQQIIGDPSYLAEPVESLKRSGILIAIDDVGFGRSCLENLIILEPDIVKIDKKFVQGISKDPLRLQLLKRLLKVVEAVGAEVVAEGIESEEDLSILRDLSVRYGQGYLLGRPA